MKDLFENNKRIAAVFYDSGGRYVEYEDFAVSYVPTEIIEHTSGNATEFSGEINVIYIPNQVTNFNLADVVADLGEPDERFEDEGFFEGLHYVSYDIGNNQSLSFVENLETGLVSVEWK